MMVDDAILEPPENAVNRLVTAPFGAKLMAKRSVMKRKASD
jgi:hypothetical protein